MATFTPSLPFAAIAAAVGWPLAAGVAVVVWSKARAAARQRRLADLEGGLRGLYQDVEAQPAPDRLMLVVDALEEAEALKPRTSAPAAKRAVGAT